MVLRAPLARLEGFGFMIASFGDNDTYCPTCGRGCDCNAYTVVIRASEGRAAQPDFESWFSHLDQRWAWPIVRGEQRRAAPRRRISRRPGVHRFCTPRGVPGKILY